jgi:hypothetical protein
VVSAAADAMLIASSPIVVAKRKFFLAFVLHRKEHQWFAA